MLTMKAFPRLVKIRKINQYITYSALPIEPSLVLGFTRTCSRYFCLHVTGEHRVTSSERNPRVTLCFK